PSRFDDSLQELFYRHRHKRLQLGGSGVLYRTVMHRESLAVVLLKPPAIIKWVKKRLSGPLEKGGHLRNVHQLKHRVVSEKFKQIKNCWYADVIENKQASLTDMGIKVVVFEIGEGIPMRPIHEHQ